MTTTNTAPAAPTTQHVKGKWEKLPDGSFGARVRCGGRGLEMVGRLAVLTSKAGDFTFVTLTDVVQDYGAGDVVTFTVQR